MVVEFTIANLRLPNDIGFYWSIQDLSDYSDYVSLMLADKNTTITKKETMVF